MVRGEVWWASLGMPTASQPGYRRPVLVVQSDLFNRSAIRTVVCLVIATNLDIGRAPGNVPLAAGASGLPKDSVINASQIITVDRSFLTERVGSVPQALPLAPRDLIPESAARVRLILKDQDVQHLGFRRIVSRPRRSVNTERRPPARKRAGPGFAPCSPARGVDAMTEARGKDDRGTDTATQRRSARFSHDGGGTPVPRAEHRAGSALLRDRRNGRDP